MIKDLLDFIEKEVRTNPFFSTAFFVGAVGFVALYARQAAALAYTWLRNRLIYRATILQSDSLFYDFEVWFYAHYHRKYRDVEASSTLRVGDGGVVAPGHPMNPAKNYEVFYKQNQGLFVIRYDGKYLLVQKGREKLDAAQSFSSLFLNQYTISGFMARTQIDELLKESQRLADSKQQPNQIRIYDHSQWGEWRTAGSIQNKQLDHIILPAREKRELIEDLDAFTRSREWYAKTGIPYKRGYLLHGPPGNGKSSLSFSIANHLQRDLYCIDLGSFNGSPELKTAFSNIGHNSILLIEDVDSYFEGRKTKGEGKISFSSFINCLDGAFYKEGLITIITTNHLDKLDPALLRSGRMDMKLEVKRPGLEEVNRYLDVFYGPDMVRLHAYTRDISMCEVQEICLRHRDSPKSAGFELAGLPQTNGFKLSGGNAKTIFQN